MSAFLVLLLAILSRIVPHAVFHEVSWNFTMLGGASHPYLGAFSSSSGMVDNAFNPVIGPSGAEVSALAFAGSRLYIGGNFTTVGGRSHPDLAAVKPSTG